jgi:hypothetical protein
MDPNHRFVGWEGVDRINLSQDTIQSRILVNTVNEYSGAIKAEKLPDQLSDY